MLFAPRLRANCARSRGVILSLPCFPSLRISRLSRAWPRSPRIAHSFSCSSSNSVVLSLSRAPAPSAASAGCWKLVLDESSRYELANHRFSSHSYSFISEIAPDGRFAVGRRRGTAQGSGCAPVGPERRRAGVQDQPQAAFAGQGRAAPGLLFGLGSRACPVRRSRGRALGSATHGPRSAVARRAPRRSALGSWSCLRADHGLVCSSVTLSPTSSNRAFFLDPVPVALVLAALVCMCYVLGVRIGCMRAAGRIRLHDP